MSGKPDPQGNAQKHPLTQQITNSDGSVVITNYKYIKDYTGTTYL